MPFYMGLKDTSNANEITNLKAAYQPAADYTGVYVFKLKSGFSFAQDITDLAKKHVTISEGEIYSMDTMTDTDGAYLLRVFVSFEGTDSSIEKVTLNTPTRSKINQAASSVGFMPTSYTPSEKMSYGLKVMVGLNQDGTGPSLEDGKFDAKQDYSVRYNLQPKDGFAFAEGFSAKDVTVSNGTVYKVEMSGKDCYVYVNFPAKAAEDPNYVTEAAVQVAAVAGEIPSINGITVTSSNADKIKTAYVLWSNTSTPFVAGQEYSTTVYLEPKEGVTFADDMKLNVNGKVVDLAKKDPNGSVQFLVKITATGSTHTHSYGTDWKYDDTNHWHECECGDKADVAAHSASEWIVDTAATETADGSKHKECTVCKKVLETAPIPATGSTHTHSYGTDWKYDDINHWHECECGDKADTAAHSFQWVIDKAATKKATGTKHEECTVCGAKRSENTVIDKLPDGGNTGNTGSGDNNTNKPGKDDSTKSPQTGDNSNLIGWLAALFVSGGVLTLLGLNGKKRRESEAE